MSEFCINDLVANEQLGCTVLAGTQGLNRRLLWAHSCELEDPWNWVSSSELLMTVGICIPAGTEQQCAFIRSLDTAGLAGLAIGDDLKAPPLTADMLAEADRLQFPVLQVSHTTPFAAIARTVAIASQSEQISRIARLSRLYELARTASLDEESVLIRLSAELGHQLHVVDVAYRSEVLRADDRLPSPLINAIADQLAPRLDRLPARSTVRTSDPLVAAVPDPAEFPTPDDEHNDLVGTGEATSELDASTETLAATVFALPTHRRCVLAVPGPTEVDIDVFTLLHAQNLIAIEVEKNTRERERTDESGAALFRQIIDESIGMDAARVSLDKFGLTAQSYVVLSFGSAHLPTARLLSGDVHVPNLSLAAGSEAFLLIAEDRATTLVPLLQTLIPALGSSAPTAAVQHLSDSTRQAAWALQAAEADGGGFAAYSTAAPLFLPRTVADAHVAARAILGPLLDYDAENNSDLVETLEAFLRADRSWGDAAATLLIHRQTLGYRLRRIESLTGRSTRRTADIALFWMALLAHGITKPTNY